MSELLYQLALTMVPHIGNVQAKILVQHLGSATAIFKSKTATLEKIEGIGEKRARSIKQFKQFVQLESELRFIEQFRIQSLFLNDAAYPQRLAECFDPPTLLFYKGLASLNVERSIAIVGTRTYTEQGKKFTEKFINDLAPYDVSIISGLAFGIDAIAHRSALKNNLPTVGVVAHGLDKIYPDNNTNLAKEMIKYGGGIITEFFSGTKPDRYNFPSRNRIVAGMTHATVIIETHLKGGSMITANLANSYNRDIFAVPGRPVDRASLGCNHLIRSNKAILLTSAEQLLETMGWSRKHSHPHQTQKELFIQLSENEKLVFTIIRDNNGIHIDELNLMCGFTTSATASALLNLELNNLIQPRPGRRYTVM